MSYKSTHSFDERKEEVKRLRKRYPDRVPIIVEKAVNCLTLSDIPHRKFLIECDYTMGYFMFIIRKKIKLDPDHALFFFVGNNLISGGQLISSVYEEHKDACGTLFIEYHSENTFG